METTDYFHNFQEIKARPAVYTDLGKKGITEIGFNPTSSGHDKKMPNDQTYSFPLFLIAYILYKIAKGAFSNDDDTKLQVEREKRIKKAISHGIQYIVNGRQINVPVSKYYIQYLGLQNNDVIYLEDIRSAALTKFHQYESGKDDLPVGDMIDIKAANSFLTDQWCYMHTKN